MFLSLCGALAGVAPACTAGNEPSQDDDDDDDDGDDDDGDDDDDAADTTNDTEESHSSTSNTDSSETSEHETSDQESQSSDENTSDEESESSTSLDESSDSASSDASDTSTSDGETSSGGGCVDAVTDDTVSFAASCLIWQRKINSELPWREYETGIATAPNFCEDLQWAGRDDWRLPTIEELQGIVVADNYPTADLELFPDTPFGGMWSSTATPDGLHVSVIDFSNGKVHTFGTDGPQKFRCVHSGE